VYHGLYIKQTVIILNSAILENKLRTATLIKKKKKKKKNRKEKKKKENQNKKN
jgi:hypothetical protein